MLKEGAHYQCVFYGGRILAHLTAEDPTKDGNSWMSILKVNRNAIILLDSDKRDKSQTLNSTKNRVIAEIEKMGGIARVTKGKEVENYISTSAMAKLYPEQKTSQVGQYDVISDYLDTIKENEGKKFLRSKVLFAERICQNLSKNDLKNILDLDSKLNDVCECIRGWNSIKSS